MNLRKSFKRTINGPRNSESICSYSIQEPFETCKSCFFALELSRAMIALSSCLISASNSFFIIDFQCDVDDYNNDINIVGRQYLAFFN